MVSLIGIIISLVLLVLLAMKGFNLLLIAPVLAMLVAVFSGMNIVQALTGPYMAGFAKYITNYYLIFMFGSVFGKLMDDSNAAKSIAEGLMKLTGGKSKMAAMIAIALVTAVLTYGGVSLFVVIFAVMPIARPLWRELDLPWPLFLAAFITGSGTFTMTMLPGTPQIQNVIPTTYLGTTLTAAPLIGIVSAIIVFTLNMIWIKWELGKYEKKGIGYEPTKGAEAAITTRNDIAMPSLILSLIPPVALLVLLNVVKVPIVGSMALGCVICLALFWKHYENPLKSLGTGAANTAGPILNTCAVVGFGGVVGASAGYAYLVSALTSIPGHPLVQLVIAINLLAGITGSASGGLAIGMDTLTPIFASKVHPEAFHRLASIASGGLDGMPHNGAVVSTISVAGLTHKTGYWPIFVCQVVNPILTSIVSIIMALAIYHI